MNFIQLALSPNTYIGALLGAAIVALWAVFWHGPNEYERAELETRERLVSNYNDAVGDLTDAGDKAVARQVMCIADGGMWFAGRGECRYR